MLYRAHGDVNRRSTPYLLVVLTRRAQSSPRPWASPSCRSRMSARWPMRFGTAVEVIQSQAAGWWPYRFVQADPPTMKVRKGGRTVIAHTAPLRVS